MAKIVLGRLDKFDLRNTLADVSVTKVAHEIVVDDQEQTYILADLEENLQAVGKEGNELYIPADLLTTADRNIAQTKVYFDLENYPFYQKAKEIIESDTKPKGVFRFRRMIKQEVNESLIVEDLYVLSSLLGELKDVQVSRTNQSITPTHIILMVDFGSGTMAHIEYTFSETGREEIEFEWSGVKNIIEFDSEELKPVQPDQQRNLLLIYPVDSVLETAHEINDDLIERLSQLQKLIDGGVK